VADKPAEADVDSEEMPAGMWVHEIDELLGERCCKPMNLSRKKRKCGPGTSCQQQFLVRGMFLVQDATAGEDSSEDDQPEPNTFWVDRDKLLETVAADAVRDALRERHERVMEDLEEE